MSDKKQVYYFADGKKIRLTPMDDLVAYSNANQALEAEAITVSKKEQVDSSSKSEGGKGAPGGLEKEYPVYASDATGYMVALPEIRVQEHSAKPTAKFTEWLRKNEERVEVIEQKRGQTILCPVSGKGEDAIEIANEIYLAIQPSMSQPRFLRIVDRPSTHEST